MQRVRYWSMISSIAFWTIHPRLREVRRCQKWALLQAALFVMHAACMINKLCGRHNTRYAPPPASGDLNGHPERPGDLLTLEPTRNVSRGTDNLPANFGISATFRCPVMGNRASIKLTTWPHYLDLITLTFDVIAHLGDAGHRTPSLYQVWSSSISHFGRCNTFFVSAALISLMSLTSELSTSK